MKSLKRILFGTCVVGCCVGNTFFAAPVRARAEFLQQARELGYKANNCQYCHLSPISKGWNERGKFLIAEKIRRNAEEVDVAWLKDYKGDK